MKHILFIAFILISGRSCFAQNESLTKPNEKASPLLNEFNFSKDGYVLLGHLATDENDTAFGAWGDFYIDNISTLNEIKSKWIFQKKEAQPFDCQQRYFINICKNGLSEKDFCIRNDCNKIALSTVKKNETHFYYYNYQYDEYAFDTLSLLPFRNSFKNAYKEVKRLPSLDSARKYLASIISDTSLIMVIDPIWIKLDGVFTITYSHKLTGGITQIYSTALTDLSKEMKKNYPGEPFFLDGQGLGVNDLVVEIFCNKALADTFNLYPIECCKWEPFEPILISYWKTKR